MNMEKIGTTRIADIAGSLYDGGWRKDDREQLIEEYELTEDEADAVCELLGEMEEADEAEAMKEIAEDEKAEKTVVEHFLNTLWLDGWTRDDREQLIEQYGFTEDEADAVCRLLGKIEETEEAEAMKKEAMKRIADTLWLDGYTKDDRAQLIEQYDLTADDADAICELLGEIEEAEVKEEQEAGA